MNSQFYVGIVESRDDPLKLDRYQVRVFGVHSESLIDVSTSSLPWAIALNDSASISGVGKNSSYVCGSMVFVFFQDGDSKQQPIILGGFHGVPIDKGSFGQNYTSQNESIEDISSVPIDQTNQKSTIKTEVKPTSSNTLSDSSGNPVTDSSGNPIQSGEINTRQKLKDALGFKESSNNYKAVNRLNYLGKYQMGAAMLTDLGYVKKGSKNRDLDNPSSWTGKSGITSKESWLNSPSVQETAMDAELVQNEKSLKRLKVIDSSSTEQEICGYLATSHLLGTGGARDMKNGKVKSDANGVTGNAYYDLGYKAASGVSPKVLPESTVVDNPAREPSVKPSVGTTISSSSTLDNSLGFRDPAGNYPRYTKEQDTNRLARNQNIDKTIVPIKEQTEDKGVRLANGNGTWDQSSTPYNTKYPYNKVLETESGHVMEFDDTPNNERINIHHRSGTFTEIDRNGTRVNKIVGDAFEILERNGYIHIKGSCSITVEGDANILVGNNCELEIDGNLNANISGSALWSIGGDWKVKSGGVQHSTSSGFAADATTINLNSGTSTAGSLSSPSRSSDGVPTFSPLSLEPRGFEELSEFEEGDMTQAEATARGKELEAKGLTDANPTPAQEGKTEEVKPIKKEGEVVECDMFVSGAINIQDYISTNFRLKDLTLGKQIPIQQGGIKDTELACNLKKLAVNVLEPIKKKYPDMIISSGLRPMGSNARSQHPKGQAADIQFTSHSSAQYIDIAKDIMSFASTDQLILEYRTAKRRNGAPTTWIHVSYTDSRRGEVFTMDNDIRISDFGQLKLVT